MTIRGITRRDFLNGTALSLVAGGTLSPRELLGAAPAYPPALTGMRGSHPGSFEVAHALAWAGKRWPRPEQLADDPYDLVVVGGGLSGLAAAFWWRQRRGGSPRILVLDNHDDFGGHAKRNEFTVDGRRLVGYGGSQSIDSPASWSPAAARLLRDLGIRTAAFYEHFDQTLFRKLGLVRGAWFSHERYGRDQTLPSVFSAWGDAGTADPAATVRRYPISDAGRAALLTLLTQDGDPLAGLGRREKIAQLRRESYTDFLQRRLDVPKEVTDLLRDGIRGLWGVGWDSLSALEGYRLGMPGTRGLGLGELDDREGHGEEPYIFHFPDGNAAIARALVRDLIPGAVPGSGMEDLVLGPVHYDRLDRPDQDVRLRLLSTAVDVRHAPDGRSVDVSYLRDGAAERVRCRHAILACYNAMVPHLCSEVPAAQRAAIEEAEKVPLVYLSVAVRNWRPLANLGFHDIQVPQPAFMHSFGLDFPVSMGGYEFARSPDRPTVLHGTFVPAFPDQGLSGKEQHRRGRRQLFEMSYTDMEAALLRQLDGALGGAGFDAERDIAAITVNRWPHGYAYEYNELFDPPEYDRHHGPHIAGAARLGRISIANSDAAGFAYVDGAFDAAHRAVTEQLGEH